MKHVPPTSYARRHTDDVHQLHVEYNLEKEPLQTGMTTRGDGLWLRLLRLLDGKDGRRNAWRAMELWLIGIGLTLSVIVTVLLVHVIAKYLHAGIGV